MDRQQIKRNKSKCNTKGIHQTTREETKRTRQEQRRTTKTTRKKLTKCQKAHTYQ